MKYPVHNREEGPTKQRSRPDTGSTFIELLVSVVLLGTAGIAVLTGMAATLRATSIHDRLATVQSRVSDAGDFLTDITYGADTYEPCATAPAVYETLITAWQVSVDAVEVWDEASGSWVGCGSDVGQIQRITLSASMSGLERTLVVVKREATNAGGPGGSWNDDMVSPLPNPGL